VKVPFLDLRVTDPDELSDLLNAFRGVLEHGRLVMGPEIEELEGQIASDCGRQHCVTVGSGTDALYLGLRALGIGPADEVITTSLSWIATANAIALTGATPVFADIDNDLNVDPASVESLVSSRTKAILTVNYTGRIAENTLLESIAEDHGLMLIEDASQSYGASLDDRVSGSFGVLSAMSHNPMKVFAATGEAGSVVVDDPVLAKRLETLRYNGTVNRETCVEPSLNGRMDTVQAAELLIRRSRLPQLLETRRRNAEFYTEVLHEFVTVPATDERHKDVFYTFTIRSSQRDYLRKHLEERGIETKIQHPLLMPQQPAYTGSRGQWAQAERLLNQVLCIPIHEKLTQDQLEYVADAVTAFGDTRVG
jgi:dTDP-4-amino-4,6-dideoxygalactose transaminase